jgi:peptide/nickel transport system permease protein
MVFFVAKRLAQSILVMLVVALIAFALFRYVGDPVNNLVGQDTSLEDRMKLTEELGLNDPFYVQFARFIGNAVQGDFGQSYRLRRPVSELIAERFPATLELSMVSALMALAAGVPMGVYTALNRRGIISRGFMTFSLIGISLPTFLIGILMILIFGVILRWLPAITLAIFQMTLIVRLVRAEMMEVLRTDYIKFARARGLKPKMINYSIALKNTLVPVITIIGLQVGSIIAFAIITESVFQWPGMGLLFIQAVSEVDIPIMAAYLMLIAFVFVVINLIVDILYFVVDPRLRVQS